MTSNRPYLLRAVHEWISDNGMTPYIVVDAAYPGVRVPPQAVQDDRVVLNIALRAVANLDLGNERVRCMARFGGVSHAVELPIGAVHAIYARENGQGMMFPQEGDATGETPADSAPLPQLVGVEGERQSSETSPADEPPPKGPPKLRVVK